MSTLVRSVRWFAVLALATFSLVGCATTDAELADDEESAEQVDEATLSRSAKLETFRGVDGRYYFYLLAGNGQKVLRSQGYSREADARTGMLAVRNNGTTRAHYVILASRNGEYYFNLKAANGEIIATSETYVTRTNASRAVTTTIRVINLLPADPIATPAPTRAGFQIFTGEDGKRYFRLRAGNGEIVLQSEAYSTRTGALNGIGSVRTNGVTRGQYDVIDSANGQFYFRLVAGNGATVGHSETYASRSNTDRAVDSLVALIRTNPALIE